jgi:hypothetical protein
MTLPDAAGRISSLAADWKTLDAPGDSPRPLPTSYRLVIARWPRARLA